jgi:hypothetical protein
MEPIAVRARHLNAECADSGAEAGLAGGLSHTGPPADARTVTGFCHSLRDACTCKRAGAHAG